MAEACVACLAGLHVFSVSTFLRLSSALGMPLQSARPKPAITVTVGCGPIPAARGETEKQEPNPGQGCPRLAGRECHLVRRCSVIDIPAPFAPRDNAGWQASCNMARGAVPDRLVTFRVSFGLSPKMWVGIMG